MTATKTDNRYINIIKSLTSDKSKEVLTAIKQLRKHGKPEAITHLISLYKTTKDAEIKEVLEGFFFDLKDQTATEVLITEIENEDDVALKTFLISILWQSSLDASEHIHTLVTQAIKGDYMTCVEVMTVMDSFETTFQEEEIQDIDFDLADAIDSDDGEKRDILITLKNALSSLNIEF